MKNRFLVFLVVLAALLGVTCYFRLPPGKWLAGDERISPVGGVATAAIANAAPAASSPEAPPPAVPSVPKVPPVSLSAPAAEKIWQEVLAEEKESRLGAARAAAMKLWRASLGDPWTARLLEKLEYLNQTIVFSSLPGDGSRIVTVKSGDTLARLAETCKVPYPFLMKINELPSAGTIRLGQDLKVVDGPFRVQVELKKYRLLLWLGGNLVKSYPVAIGLNDTTPPGKYQVINRIRDPEWTDPQTGKVFAPNAPDNPLGPCWIGITRPHYGLHGTNDEDSIGKAASRGCIRLRNKDALELFDLLLPKESTVEIL